MNKSKQQSYTLIVLSLFWITLIFSMLIWWFYLFSKYESQLKIFLQTSQINSRMLFWEGSSFIILIVFLSVALFIFYFKEQQKAKSLTRFFSSLSYKLKIPLGSLILESETLLSLLKGNKSPEKIYELSKQLIYNSKKLETEVNNIFQLSNIERNFPLQITTINLNNFLDTFIESKKMNHNIQFSIISEFNNLYISADHVALKNIFECLFENTQCHTKTRHISIYLSKEAKHILMSYDDRGFFSGDISKLGTLFYQHNASKGFGVGLYLIKQLTKKMNAIFSISATPNLSFNFKFKVSQQARD